MKQILLFLTLCISSITSTYATNILNFDGSITRIEQKETYTKAIQNAIDGFVSGLIPTNVATLRDPGDMGDTNQYEYNIKIEKVYQDAKYTSITITFTSYTGGAHGSYSQFGLVFDTASGKRLQIEDLFLGKKLTYRLSPIWQKSIQKSEQEMKEKSLTPDEKAWIKDGTTDIQNYQWFSITEKNLIIYGQQYQHAAYAYGTFDLKYPLVLLRKLKK